MPLLDITESNKVTALVNIESTTARRIEQYAAMTKGTPDRVVEQALEYVFSKDKDFEAYVRDHPTAQPKVALRLKKSAATPGSTNTTRSNPAAAR